MTWRAGRKMRELLRRASWLMARVREEDEEQALLETAQRVQRQEVNRVERLLREVARKELVERLLDRERQIMELEERRVLGKYLRILLRSYEVPRYKRREDRREIHINDPIHGRVVLEDPVISIFETPFFQRLALIRQLSFAYLIPEYRAAHHTRLEHSLGVMYLIHQLFERNTNFRRGLEEYSSKDLTELKTEALIAGLLHDAGHPPFGHGLEPLVAPHGIVLCGLQAISKHYSVLLLCEYLDSHELFLKDILEDEGICVDDIKKILLGPDYLGGHVDPAYQALNYLLDSDMDVDRMDYLLRDLYFTNPTLGRGFEEYKKAVRRLLDSMTLIDPPEELSDRFQLVIGFKAEREGDIKALLALRDLMYREVYGHDVNAACEYMLCHATYLLWLEMGGTSHERTLREIIRLPDPYLLFLLHLSADPYVRELALRLETGVPFSCIRISLTGDDRRRWLEQQERLVGGMAYSPVYEFEWFLTKTALNGAEGVKEFCGYPEERPLCFIDIFEGLRRIRRFAPRPYVVYPPPRTGSMCRRVKGRRAEEGRELQVRVFIPHELEDRERDIKRAFSEALAF